MTTRTMLVIGLAACGALLAAAGPAAARELPDELTLNVGTVMLQDTVGGTGAASVFGNDVTVVLTKRSMRADDCRCVLWTDEGFEPLDVPVTTYRGHVKGDPAVQVNGNIEPDGVLNLNFSENRGIIARVRGLKIAVPEGRCTPGTSTGNKVVPLASLPQRPVPSPGGYLVPAVPMRRTRWLVQVYATYTAHAGIEKAVSEVEQRMNDGDFVYARDVGTAWEIDTLLVIDPRATKPADLDALYPGDAQRLARCKRAGFTGVPGRNQGKRHLNVTGVHHEARILLHESAHVYGNPWHQLGNGDGLCGGGAFWDTNNVAILLEAQKSLGDDEFPGVVYHGALPPCAAHDFATTRKDAPVTIDVLENDYDGNGDSLTLAAVQEKSDKGGTVAIGDGKAVYTPAPGFVGQDTFAYTVADGGGIANRSGRVKVDVRTDGLAAHFDFEEPVEELIETRRDRQPPDPELAFYDLYDDRPAAEKLLYHFRNRGPADGGPAVAHWIKYFPVDGIRGRGLWNPGLLPKATAKLGNVGDPGRESMSVSLWVLYADEAPGGHVILCKGGVPTPLCNGWSISRREGGGFTFAGNTVRILEREIFRLESTEPIQPRKWYHLAMAMDRGSRRLRAWVDNKELGTPGTPVPLPDGVIEYYGGLYAFNGYGGKWWNGSRVLIDDVKIFTAALTDAQVAELHAEGKDARTPSFPAPTASP